MRRRRRRPPLLARVPGGRQGDRGLHRVDRRQLEAFEAVRGALGGARVAMVAREGDDPSVAVGLASACVAAGRRAVVVECGLRRPVLAATLGVERSPGLGEHLGGRAEAGALLQPVVLAGPGAGRAVEPLVCIVAGEPRDDGAALLASDAFRRAIAGLRRSYDLVALDAPALEDDHSLAAAAEADAIVSCRPDRRLPRRLREIVDGIVVLE